MDDCFNVDEDDKFLETSNQQTMGFWWSGYSFFEFDPMLTTECEQQRLYEVNEVSMKESME